MRRRTLVSGAIAAALALADSSSDALEAVAPLAAALSEGSAGAFMSRIPSDCPGRAELRANVEAFVAAAEATSSVRVLRTTDDHAADLDWYLEIRGRVAGMLVERRRGVVRVTLQGRELRAIGPPDFFRPPKVGP